MSLPLPKNTAAERRAELSRKGDKSIADARAMLDTAEREKRDLTDDEAGRYQGLVAEAHAAASGRKLWQVDERPDQQPFKGIFSSPAVSADGRFVVIGQGIERCCGRGERTKPCCRQTNETPTPRPGRPLVQARLGRSAVGRPSELPTAASTPPGPARPETRALSEPSLGCRLRRWRSTPCPPARV